MKTFFVSSTFKDMNYERDAIREITLPKLNTVAKKYGKSVTFCDLRWGIDTSKMSEAESSQKVLRVCLDEIDRCRPPLVIILGERYGWIPPKDIVKGVAEYKKLIIDDYEKSVTALEIEYGALCKERENERTLIYIREMENPPEDYLAEDLAHKEKLDALKERLYKLANGKVRTYRARFNGEKLEGITDFAEMLADDLSELMLQEWENEVPLSPFELDRRIQWDYVEEKSKYFEGRAELLSSVCEDIENGKRFTFIKGETGSGKSTLFSAVAMKLKSNDWDVLPFIGGYTLESNDAIDILNNTIYYLEEALGKEHGEDRVHDENEKVDSIESAQRRVAELCYEYSKKGKRFIIMLDSVESLHPDEVRDRLRFIPENLGDNIRFFMTANNSFNTVGVEYSILESLSDEDKIRVVDGILKRVNRELDMRVKMSIINMPSSNNPLYLSMLIQRLLMMNSDDFFSIRSLGDGMSAITMRQMQLIASCPDKIDKLCSTLIFEAGHRINPSLIRKITEYIAFSRFGVRESDLEKIIGEEWRAVDFAHFIAYMGDSFIMRDDGRIDFSHQSIRDGIVKDCALRSEIYDDLFLHFESMPEDDIVRETEILYHAIKAEKSDYIIDRLIRNVNSISSPDVEKMKEDIKTVYDVIRADGIEWFIDLLSNAKEKERIIKLSAFINSAVITKFEKRQSDLAIGVEILKASRDVIAKQKNDDEDFSVAEILTDIYLAQVSLLYDAKNSIKLAEESVGRGLEGAIKLYNSSPNTENKKVLSVAMWAAILCYIQEQNRIKLKLAVDILEKLIDLTKDLKFSNPIMPEGIAGKYTMLSGLYSQLNDSASLQKALECAKLAVEVAKAENAPRSLINEARINLGLIYLTIGGLENIETALEIYKKTYWDAQIAYSRSGDVSDMESLLVIRNNYIKALYDSGVKGALDKALPEALENIKAAEVIASELDTVAAIRPLIMYYYNAANTYSAMGGNDNMAHAKKMLKKAERTAEIVASRISQNGVTLELVTQKLMLSKVYNSVNILDNVGEALRIVNEAIEIVEAIRRDNPDTQHLVGVECDTYGMATIVYINKAMMNVDMGDRDDLDKAIHYAERAIECAEALKEMDVNDWEGRLSMALNNAGFVYRSIYIINLQLSEYFKTNIGSEETMAELWLMAAARTPSEAVWLRALSEEDLDEAERRSILNVYEEELRRGFDSEEEKEKRKSELISESVIKMEEADKIKEASRLRAIEYYTDAVDLMEKRLEKLQTMECYANITTMYQNLADMCGILGDENSLRIALKYQLKGIEYLERQNEIMDSKLSQYQLLVAKMGNVQTYIGIGDFEKAFPMICPILKEAEKLYKVWQTQEMLVNMNQLCSIFSMFFFQNADCIAREDAEYIYESYVNRLKEQFDAGTLSDINEYTRALVDYAGFLAEYGTGSFTEAAAFAKEAYDMLMLDNEPDYQALVLAQSALITLQGIYEKLNMTDSMQFYEVTVEIIEMFKTIDDYLNDNDITEESETYAERCILMLNNIKNIYYSPFIEDDDCKKFITEGYYVALEMLDEDDDYLHELAEEYISFMAEALSHLPGGKDLLEKLLGDGAGDDDGGGFEGFYDVTDEDEDEDEIIDDDSEGFGSDLDWLNSSFDLDSLLDLFDNGDEE